MGLDLGDRWSWYCVLDERGEVVFERKVSATPKALREVFGAMPHSWVALETGTHSPQATGARSSELGAVVSIWKRRIRTPNGHSRVAHNYAPSCYPAAGFSEPIVCAPRNITVTSHRKTHVCPFAHRDVRKRTQGTRMKARFNGVNVTVCCFYRALDFGSLDAGI